MRTRLVRGVPRLCLGLVLLLVAACRSDPEVARDADFVSYAYEVPEVRYGPRGAPEDGRAIDVHALPTPSGTAVLTRLHYRVPDQLSGCCSTVRLVNLDAAGAVVSEHVAVTQTEGTVDFELLPLGADDDTVRVAVTETIQMKISPSDVRSTNVHTLWLMDLPRDGSERARPEGIALPFHVTLENVFRREDGLTVLTGTRAEDGEELGWIGIVGPDNTMQVHHAFPDGLRRRVHAHDFTEHNTLVLLEWANRWDESGSTHALSHREIDLESARFTETSLFGFPRSALTDSPLGKIGPDFANVVALPEGGFVATMPGWYGGAFEKLRLVRISAEGEIAWRVTLIPGKGQETPLLALGDDGEIWVTGHSDGNQYLFRIARDGTTRATHPVRSLRIDTLLPHPEGGLFAWVQGPVGADAKYMTLLRMEALPAVEE